MLGHEGNHDLYRPKEVQENEHNLTVFVWNKCDVVDADLITQAILMVIHIVPYQLWKKVIHKSGACYENKK